MFVFNIVNAHDCRINREFEQQMETFISGTLAFLENSGAKRVRGDTDETSSILDKDRRCFSLDYST
jgi:hypothetical protein